MQRETILFSARKKICLFGPAPRRIKRPNLDRMCHASKSKVHFLLHSFCGIGFCVGEGKNSFNLCPSQNRKSQEQRPASSRTNGRWLFWGAFPQPFPLSLPFTHNEMLPSSPSLVFLQRKLHSVAASLLQSDKRSIAWQHQRHEANNGMRAPANNKKEQLTVLLQEEGEMKPLLFFFFVVKEPCLKKLLVHMYCHCDELACKHSLCSSVLVGLPVHKVKKGQKMV